MVRVIDEKQLRDLVGMDSDALAAVEDGFARLGRGEVTIPPIMGIEIPEHNGAMDAKAAYVHGWDVFAVKVSTRFFDNPARGLPSGSGLMTLIDSTSGAIRAVLLDNGYLTTVRTALAGALAAKYLAPERIATVGVIGAGSQAAWQLRALPLVRAFRRVLVWSRNAERSRDYATTMSRELDRQVVAVDSPEQAVVEAQLLITTTPATAPLIPASWLHPGLHITAMGSDAAHKNELEPALLGAADILACDLNSQCLLRGELHHAARAGVIGGEHPARELGDIINASVPGRTAAEQTSICDLTGVGVQDTAIARHALARLTGS